MRFCDICGRQATFKESAVIDGKEVEIFLCDKCGKSADRNHLSTADLVRVIKSTDGRYCPVCGTTEKTFAETFRFGCASCYEYMREVAVATAEKVQDSIVHTGKAPRR